MAKQTALWIAVSAAWLLTGILVGYTIAGEDTTGTPELQAPTTQQELIRMCGAEDMVWDIVPGNGSDDLGCVHIDVMAR